MQTMDKRTLARVTEPAPIASRRGRVRPDALSDFYKGIVSFKDDPDAFSKNMVQDLSAVLIKGMGVKVGRVNVGAQMMLHYIVRLIFAMGTMSESINGGTPIFPLIPIAQVLLVDPNWKEGFPKAPYSARSLVELVNATYKTKLGRDVFLTDGEYRARPVAISLFAWGIYESRAEVLEKNFGEIDWLTIHDAAIAPGGWREIGGEGEWGYFKLVVPHPRKNIGGLAAMVSAAGEYYGKPKIAVEDVTDPDFQRWLKELMGSVSDYSSLGAYPGENLALFGYSAGDGGQLLESDLLINMSGSMNRWEPLRIYYPRYLTWFDFPFTVWIGPETTALEKNAALEFEKYLLSPDVQAQAVGYGLRPVSGEITVDHQGSPFVDWKDNGVATVVERTTAMRNPDRDVLLALLRWFDLNIAQ